MNAFEHEVVVIRAMVGLRCRTLRHAGSAGLCPECAGLLEYAKGRLLSCPQLKRSQGRAKPSCRSCAIHCFGPAERQRVRELMRWAGPRLLWRHPVISLRHIVFKLFRW